MVRRLVTSDLKGVGIICCYQESFLPVVKNDNDKFFKINDLIDPEKEYIMTGLTEDNEINDLIKYNLDENINISAIESELIKIILQKSFKGIPMFIIELVKSLLSSKLIKINQNVLSRSPELEEMNRYNEWNSFNLPIRFEKVLMSIIDSMEVKEIVILKYAAVIGNIFDLEKLNKILTFNNINEDDLYKILQKFEVNLYSFNIHI